MKALIVYYSKTGNTGKFARKIAEQIEAAGAEAELHELQTVSPVPDNFNPSSMDFELKPVPDLSGYEYVVIGTPIWVFRAAPFVIKYINGLDNLKGKKVIPFVTMGFPFAFLGGNGAISKIANLVLAKGAIPLKGSVITYMFSKPDEQMDIEAQRIAHTIK